VFVSYKTYSTFLKFGVDRIATMRRQHSTV